MNHEQFLQRARETLWTPEGQRLDLASHARELYYEIRTVLENGNAYLYVADVLIKARGDKTDALAVVDRLRTYQCRDRKEAGDAKIVRGSRALSLKRSRSSPSISDAVPLAKDMVRASDASALIAHTDIELPQNQSSEIRTVPIGSSADSLRALTLEVHKKRNRRLVSAHGG